MRDTVNDIGGAVLRGALWVAGLLVVWWVAHATFAPPAFIFPGPQAVFQAIAAQWGYLAHHAGITFLEMVLGLIVGTVLGVATALTVTLFRPARHLVLPLLVASQALPVFAIAPLLVIWLGFGLASKIAMATLIIYFPVASAFYDGLRRTEPHLLDLARLYGASNVATTLVLRVPAALPALASGLRVAAAIAPIGAVVGEWVGASAGLGFVMLQANARVQTALVFACLLFLAVAALALRLIVEFSTRRLVHWVDELPA
ncbi:ABC transporter permease [Tepidamorphus sp. 3E244]|uniref:ABC transporter permease n=1 Tax=Tepidamorphus sp. 3E244 TaxID=3385498 RepID=UPI0038FC4841